MHRFLPAAAVVLALALCGVAAPAFAQSDADFLAARAAFDRGDRVRLDALAPKLTGHVLAPYVESWQLRLRIDAAGDDEIRGFVARWPQTPFADRLRVEWLKSLGKRGRWPTFGAEYRPPAGEDPELSCYGIQYRRLQEGDGALSQAKPLWFSGQSTPEACEPLFGALMAKGELTPDDRRARFRLATEAGNIRLAQSIAVDLPSVNRIATREFFNVERDPARALAAGDFRWKQPGGRDLALYALERAARTDAAGVRAAWVRQRSLLPVADRLYGNARLAYHAARQLNPQAAQWFREADAAALSERLGREQPVEAEIPGERGIERHCFAGATQGRKRARFPVAPGGLLRLGRRHGLDRGQHVGPRAGTQRGADVPRPLRLGKRRGVGLAEPLGRLRVELARRVIG